MPVCCLFCSCLGRPTFARCMRVVAIVVLGLALVWGMAAPTFAQDPGAGAAPVQGMVEGKSYFVEYAVFAVMVGLAIFAVGRSSRRT